ncbi:MAG: conserved phage C-terminal domain-containing protein [Desulfuromonadaceae bacterium]|nr:conserved phage C-terminal domain-containing protein [Desulfuromonadaceae bacterium]
MHSTANGAGWIKFHSAVKHSIVYRDSEHFHLWIHLLLSANHEPAAVRLDDGREIELAAGQFIASRSSLARATGICESKIERTINRYNIEQMIEQITFSKFRIISICNWHEYQGGEQITEQKTNQKPNTVKEVRSKKEKYRGVSPDVFQQIAAFLNEVTGKNYKATGSALTKGVTARLKEGFGFDDFKRVIEFKQNQWGADAKMSAYLRPETLFSPKFESYLQEAGGAVEDSGGSSWQDRQAAAVIDELLEE